MYLNINSRSSLEHHHASIEANSLFHNSDNLCDYLTNKCELHIDAPEEKLHFWFCSYRKWQNKSCLNPKLAIKPCKYETLCLIILNRKKELCLQ